MIKMIMGVGIKTKMKMKIMKMKMETHNKANTASFSQQMMFLMGSNEGTHPKTVSTLNGPNPKPTQKSLNIPKL